MLNETRWTWPHKQVYDAAERVAYNINGKEIAPKHILSALLFVPSKANVLLKQLRTGPETNNFWPSSAPPKPLSLSTELTSVYEYLQTKKGKVGTIDLLGGLCRLNNRALFEDFNLNIDRVRDKVMPPMIGAKVEPFVPKVQPQLHLFTEAEIVICKSNLLLDVLFYDHVAGWKCKVVESQTKIADVDPSTDIIAWTSQTGDVIENRFGRKHGSSLYGARAGPLYHNDMNIIWSHLTNKIESNGWRVEMSGPQKSDGRYRFAIIGTRDRITSVGLSSAYDESLLVAMVKASIIASVKCKTFSS